MALKPKDGREASPLPMSEFQATIEGAADRLSGRTKHCLRGAFNHLHRAWAIKDIDPEMSAFRAITGEEEAATALILSIKSKQYPGHEKLNLTQHDHKNAIWAVIRAVSRVLGLSGIPNPDVSLTKRGMPTIKVRIDLGALVGLESVNKFIEPDHPLNFSISAENKSKSNENIFVEELDKIADERSEQGIKFYIKEESNTRNRLLYADDNGFPTISLKEEFILDRLRRVCVIGCLVYAVNQTSCHQLLVIQCLDAILKAMNIKGWIGQVTPKSIDLAGRPTLRIRRVGKEPATFGWAKQIVCSYSLGGLTPKWYWQEPVKATVSYS